jgi:hypothetical protein
MDYSKPWGWAPSKAAGPLGNTIAPLAASAASMPGNTVLPEDPNKAAARQVGAAVGMEGLKQLNKDTPPLGAPAQDSATKAALYGAEGYGDTAASEAASAAAADAASGVMTDATTSAATDVAVDTAKDAAVDAALDTSSSSFVPGLAALKLLSEGEYAQAAASALGTYFTGGSPIGGAVAQGLTKWIGLADGTPSVAAPMSGDARAAARNAAGARFSPELFKSMQAPTATRPTAPTGAQALAGGKGSATGGMGLLSPQMAQAIAQQSKSIVAPMAPAPTQPAPSLAPDPYTSNINTYGFDR